MFEGISREKAFELIQPLLVGSYGSVEELNLSVARGLRIAISRKKELDLEGMVSFCYDFNNFSGESLEEIRDKLDLKKPLDHSLYLRARSLIPAVDFFGYAEFSREKYRKVYETIFGKPEEGLHDIECKIKVRIALEKGIIDGI